MSVKWRSAFSLRSEMVAGSAREMYRFGMEIDSDKIDEAVLGLLWLPLHDGHRAWKGFDWDSLDRLHKKGLIGNPAGKAKSVALTDEDLKRAEELFRALFARQAP